MIPVRDRERLLRFELLRPDAVSLAELVSPASYVEPGLLREIRVTLAPGMRASAEADLWFSPLVEGWSASGFSLLPGVAALLRERLRMNPRKDEAFALIQRFHAHLPAVQLEERITWLAVQKGQAARQEIEAALNSALQALLASEARAEGISRWAANALPRLPALAQEVQAARLLAFAAAHRTGASGLVADMDAPFPRGMSAVLPHEELAKTVPIRLRRTREGVEIAGQEQWGHELQVAATEPPLLELEWEEESLSGGQPPLFSWIHLADIHGLRDGASRVADHTKMQMLLKLHSDVTRMLESGAPRPDAIFVTGDIALTGASREYEQQERWLADIARAAGLGLDSVFVVPGNHDVQRSADKQLAAATLLNALRKGSSSLDVALADASTSAQLRMRQANYLKFAAGLAPACRNDAEATGAQLYWRHTLRARGGLKVRIVGLNTALLAMDDSDRGRLRLGTRQLSAAFTEPDVSPGEAVVVLSHHPLRGGWLADEAEAARWIRSKAHLHLSGHVHEAGSEHVRAGGGTGLVSIAAGDVPEETRSGYFRQAYSFGAIVAAEDALTVRVWPRVWLNKMEEYGPDAVTVPHGATYAEHDLPHVQLPEGATRVPRYWTVAATPGKHIPVPSTVREIRIRLLDGSRFELRSATASETGIPVPLEDTEAPSQSTGTAVSIAHLPASPAQFVGRSAELVSLDQAWSDNGTHVVEIVGWGGAGKSALVAEWLARMAQENWRGAALVFGWSFYSQGARNDGAASTDHFIKSALSFFGDTDWAQDSAWGRGERLAALVRRQRTLLVLDGLESLQEPEAFGGRLRDPALTALLRELAASMDGLCIITTRQPVGEIAEFAGKMTVRVDLGQLSEHDGAQLLRLCGTKGTEDELREVSRAVQGHPLTVMLLGHYIADALDGDVRRWREVQYREAMETGPGERLRRIMEVYDRWFGLGPEREILRIAGLFDRPASAGDMAVLRRTPAISGVTDALVALTEAQWKLAVGRLRRARLLAPRTMTEDGVLDAHPVVRECFGEMLVRENPEGFRAAHRRLYEHLRDTTPQFPDTLEGLQPLYQAVWHGCRAGQPQEALDDVFVPRIRRGGEHYSALRLGAFRADVAALAGFFEGAWTRPVAGLTQASRAWVLNEAAFALRALGRLREAVAPMMLGLDESAALSDWTNAAIVAANLAELHASRGALHEALSMADRSVEYADRSGEADRQMISRSARAAVLHSLGHREDARILFEEAERMQAAQDPQSPLLYSLRGYRLCSLLLDLGEVQEVERRARQTLAWMEEKHVLLAIALDHRSLFCALWMLEQRENARAHLTQAIDGLRAAGQQEFLASTLVLRAAFLREGGDRESARGDLAEALSLARSSELQLVECDAYLEQARLAVDGNGLVTAQAARDAARSLVDECVYHRRDCELALLDARLALAAGERAAARAAYERAREIAVAEKLRAYDKELAEVAAAVAEVE